MSRKKISTTIYVTPEQSERLRLLHERTKVPVAVYIREGIDLVLRQYGHLLPGQLPLADAQAPSTPTPVLVADPKPAPLRQERPERVAASETLGVATAGPERVVGGAGTKS
jgi:Ribbon-helix-helix domain